MIRTTKELISPARALLKNNWNGQGKIIVILIKDEHIAKILLNKCAHLGSKSFTNSLHFRLIETSLNFDSINSIFMMIMRTDRITI